MRKKMTLNEAKNHWPGNGCQCMAGSSYDCGCPNVDWRSRVEVLAECWRDMSDSEMRLQCGELTAQEIRSIRAVLNQISPKYDERRNRKK